MGTTPPKYAATRRQLRSTLTSKDARPCYLPRRLGPNSRRPPRLPVHPRPVRQPIPLPRGPAQQLAIRPIEEGLCLQVLGIHGNRILPAIPPCCLADKEEQALDAVTRSVGTILGYWEDAGFVEYRRVARTPV